MGGKQNGAGDAKKYFINEFFKLKKLRKLTLERKEKKLISEEDAEDIIKNIDERLKKIRGNLSVL